MCLCILRCPCVFTCNRCDADTGWGGRLEGEVAACCWAKIWSYCKSLYEMSIKMYNLKISVLKMLKYCIIWFRLGKQRMWYSIFKEEQGFCSFPSLISTCFPGVSAAAFWWDEWSRYQPGSSGRSPLPVLHPTRGTTWPKWQNLPGRPDFGGELIPNVYSSDVGSCKVSEYDLSGTEYFIHGRINLTHHIECFTCTSEKATAEKGVWNGKNKLEGDWTDNIRFNTGQSGVSSPVEPVGNSLMFLLGWSHHCLA